MPHPPLASSRDFRRVEAILPPVEGRCGEREARLEGGLALVQPAAPGGGCAGRPSLRLPALLVLGAALLAGAALLVAASPTGLRLRVASGLRRAVGLDGELLAGLQAQCDAGPPWQEEVEVPCDLVPQQLLDIAGLQQREGPWRGCAFGCRTGQLRLEPVRLECLALAAATAAYRSGDTLDSDFPGAAGFLEADGWAVVRSWSAGRPGDLDFAAWWQKDGHCMLAFAGVTSTEDLLNVAFPGKPISRWYMHGLLPGLSNELQGLLGEMSPGDFEDMRAACTDSLVATGHSMGAGLAQLFSVVANGEGGPLSPKLWVHQLFTFGGVPLADAAAELSNPATGTCFPGAQYATAQRCEDDFAGLSTFLKDAEHVPLPDTAVNCSALEDGFCVDTRFVRAMRRFCPVRCGYCTEGSTIVDVMVHNATSSPLFAVRSQRRLLFGAGRDSQEDHDCDAKVADTYVSINRFDLHDQAVYNSRLGCGLPIDARLY